MKGGKGGVEAGCGSMAQRDQDERVNAWARTCVYIYTHALYIDVIIIGL